MKVRMFKSLMAAMAILLVLPGVTFAATADVPSGSLMISVAGIVEEGDDKVIYLDFDNQTDTGIRYGYAGIDCYLVLETTQGTYSTQISVFTSHIKIGISSAKFTVENTKGTVQSIYLKNLLCGNGPLNGKLLEEIKIYDSESEMTHAVYNFDEVLTGAELFHLADEALPRKRIHNLVFPIIMVTVFVTVIVRIYQIAHRYTKSGSRSNTHFRYRSGDPNFMGGHTARSAHLHPGTTLYTEEIRRCMEIYKLRVNENSLDEAAVQLRKMLEYMLEGIRRQNGFVSWPEGVNDILRKIDTLHDWGLITEQTQNHYHTVRKITNWGAHAGGSVHTSSLYQAATILSSELNFYFGRNG